MTDIISAKRRDGTPAQRGDGVVVYLRGNRRFTGKIVEASSTFRFRYLGQKKLRTYKVMCSDGKLRTVHAWHIKMIFPARRWHRPDTAKRRPFPVDTRTRNGRGG